MNNSQFGFQNSVKFLQGFQRCDALTQTCKRGRWKLEARRAVIEGDRYVWLILECRTSEKLLRSAFLLPSSEFLAMDLTALRGQVQRLYCDLARSHLDVR